LQDRFGDFNHTGGAPARGRCPGADVLPVPPSSAGGVRHRDRGVEGLPQPAASQPAAGVLHDRRSRDVVGVQAADRSAALAQLPPYVADRTVVDEVREVPIP
jgi:hypothetical protein